MPYFFGFRDPNFEGGNNFNLFSEKTLYLLPCVCVGGGVRHIVLVLGRKSKTAFFVADSLQGKIKSLVYLGGKKLFKTNVSMDTLHRLIK